MKLRLLSLPVLALLLAPCAFGQQLCSENPQPASAAGKADVRGATVVHDKVDTNTGDEQGMQRSRGNIATRPELLRRIAVCEAAVREAEAAHATDAVLVEVYSWLGSLYDRALMFSQSEAAFERAISLLRRNPGASGQLAEDINYLGSLHALMGKERQAEKEELEALKLRQNLGDSLQMAWSWDTLAELYLREGKYVKARDFAQKAMAEFLVNKQAGVVDGIRSRFDLSEALCSTNDCPAAIPLLKEAIDLAKSTYRPNDSPIGVANFLLGFAYWKSGDQSGADEYMKQGTAIMKEQLGWGHPTYLNAMSAYARFLRERQRIEDAEVVEREIRTVEAVVDVHSIQMPKGALSLSGLR